MAKRQPDGQPLMSKGEPATSRGLTPPLKWHREGGKHYLAPKIIALFPKHIHYVEPFFGGGAVLLARDPTDKSLWLPPHKGVSEVVSDLHGDLTNFWEVLKCEFSFGQFCRKIACTPFSQREWTQAQEVLTADGVGVIDRAVAFFVRCRQSHSGRMKDFAAITRKRVRAGMNEQVSAWLNCVEGLPAVHARLKRVLILNKPALEVIRSEDSPGTLFYLDPPYLHSTRATTGEYVHEMTELQHNQLMGALKSIKGKFMLSGYRSNLYDSMAMYERWNRIDFDLPNNAAGGKTKRRMVESVWMNFDPERKGTP